MFTPYAKKSKKARRADDLAKRVTWGFSPVTRVKQSKRVYNRREAKRVDLA